MSAITRFIDIVLHLDKYLGTLLAQYGSLTYLILFLIIFIETGFIFLIVSKTFFVTEEFKPDTIRCGLILWRLLISL